MNIRKLPSGSYQISQMLNGKRYYVTTKHKPKKYEAEELIHEKIYGSSKLMPYSNSVMQIAEDYVVICERDGKSPTTTKNYRSIIRNTPEWFLDMKPADVTAYDLQKVVDQYSKNHAPKTVKNLCGFYKSVLADFSHIRSSAIKLPKNVKKAEYEPTTQDIRRIMEYIEGSDYEIVLKLCGIGLRRGEAVAITKADLDDNDVLTINKDLVYAQNKYVLKDHPKTEASNRRIRIPENIAELIRSKDVVFPYALNSIGRYLHTVQDALGIPRFRLHILRHYAAAYLHKNGFTDRQIMAYMGWDTASTMHQVYNYNLDPEESQKSIVDTFNYNL